MVLRNALVPRLKAENDANQLVGGAFLDSFHFRKRKFLMIVPRLEPLITNSAKLNPLVADHVISSSKRSSTNYAL